MGGRSLLRRLRAGGKKTIRMREIEVEELEDKRELGDGGEGTEG